MFMAVLAGRCGADDTLQETDRRTGKFKDLRFPYEWTYSRVNKGHDIQPTAT
jgi:hypothetical protein